MGETIERETEPISYRTMTTEDAIDLRIERIRELERDHYRLALVAEENGGGLSAAQDAQRLAIERRITHQVDVVWPGDSTPHTPAPDYPDGPPAAPGEVNTEQRGPRGAVREAPTFDALGDLGPALRDEEHVHHAAHGEGDPVEGDPELPEGAPLGDTRDGDGDGVPDDALSPWSNEPGTQSDAIRYDRISGQVEPEGDAELPSELSRLQRISHFPSERDRPRHAE